MRDPRRRDHRRPRGRVDLRGSRAAGLDWSERWVERGFVRGVFPTRGGVAYVVRWRRVAPGDGGGPTTRRGRGDDGCRDRDLRREDSSETEEHGRLRGGPGTTPGYSRCVSWCATGSRSHSCASRRLDDRWLVEVLWTPSLSTWEEDGKETWDKTGYSWLVFLSLSGILQTKWRRPPFPSPWTSSSSP